MVFPSPCPRGGDPGGHAGQGLSRGGSGGFGSGSVPVRLCDRSQAGFMSEFLSPSANLEHPLSADSGQRGAASQLAPVGDFRHSETLQ